ncbi:Protein asteroid 1 [Tyrophagus putrescentiae]|nr:Protein asteroid 1 [Tyrophagus putrescentiae]
MGIPLLSKFVHSHGFFESHKLHDTLLLIDGPNLMVTFNEKVNNERKDHFYGGDYNHFCHRLIKFFDALKSCNVKPIIVWESKTTDKSQMDKKLTRLNVEEEEEEEKEDKSKPTEVEEIAQKASKLSLKATKGEGGKQSAKSKKEPQEKEKDAPFPSSSETVNNSSKQSSTSNAGNYYSQKRRPSTKLWSRVITDLLGFLGISQTISFHEADALMAKVADRGIGAPILSNDSDFFFLDLPGGVISMTALLDSHKVVTEKEVKDGEETVFSYIACQRYSIATFERVFNLQRALLTTVAAPMLDFEYSAVLEALTKESHRMQQMEALFHWLGGCPSALKAARFLLKHHRGVEGLKELVTKMQYLDQAATEAAKKEEEKKEEREEEEEKKKKKEEESKTASKEEKDEKEADKEGDEKEATDAEQQKKPSKLASVIEEAQNAIEANADTQNITRSLPKYIAEGALSGAIHKRVLYILINRKDIFYPVVEDGSLPPEMSASSCCTKLCRQIYALLRRSEDRSPGNPDNQIMRYFANEAPVAVDPLYTELTTRRPLPTVWEIEQRMSAAVDDRQALFLNILEVEPSLVMKMLNLLQRHLPTAYIEELTHLSTMMLAFAYFSRNLAVELSLEYIYALMVNILFTGHTSAVAEVNDNRWKLLPFKSLPLEGLSKYDFVPNDHVKMKYGGGFLSRITHYSGSFQDCLENVLFLAKVLDISDLWDVNEQLFGLHGTFVYNLTKELMSSPAPWTFLKENVLALKKKEEGGKSVTFPLWPLYEDLVRLALEFSGRQFEASLVDEHRQQQQQQKLVIPETKLLTEQLAGKKRDKTKSKPLITRGFRSKQSGFFQQGRSKGPNVGTTTTTAADACLDVPFPKHSSSSSSINNRYSSNPSAVPTPSETGGSWRRKT